MNLYLRLLRIIFKMIGLKSSPALEMTSLQFRVWPHDCDINFHLTNARYLSFMDLGRTFLIARTGLIGKIIKKRFVPVANAVEITFIREIKPFQKFTLTTQLLGWDEKYWYIEQQFLLKDVLAAKATVRGLFLQGRRKVGFEEIVALLDIPLEQPLLPEKITAWKNLLDHKRHES